MKTQLKLAVALIMIAMQACGSAANIAVPTATFSPTPDPFGDIPSEVKEMFGPELVSYGEFVFPTLPQQDQLLQYSEVGNMSQTVTVDSRTLHIVVTWTVEGGFVGEIELDPKICLQLTDKIGLTEKVTVYQGLARFGVSIVRC